MQSKDEEDFSKAEAAKINWLKKKSHWEISTVYEIDCRIFTM